MTDGKLTTVPAHKYAVTVGLAIGVPAPWHAAEAVTDRIRKLMAQLDEEAVSKVLQFSVEYIEGYRADNDALNERAEQRAQKRYADEVRGVADEFREMAKDGDFDTAEDATRWLDQTVDGHRRVFITHLAKECMILSRNDDALVMEHGSEGIVTDDCINWSLLAYHAFRTDVVEQLDAYGIEPGDPDTWTEDEDDEDALLSNTSDDEDEDDIDPSEGAYTAADLEPLETLSTGQTCNLKLASSRYRVWLSRCTVEDGELYNNAITVEELEDGRWVERCRYEG